MKTSIFDMLGIPEGHVIRRVGDCVTWLFSASMYATVMYALWAKLGKDFIGLVNHWVYGLDGGEYVLLFVFGFCFILLVLGGIYSIIRSILGALGR